MINEVMGEDLMSFGVPVLALGDPGQLPPVHGKGYFAGEPDVMLTDVQRNAGPIIWLSQEVREGRSLKVGNYDGCEVVDLRTIGKQGLADRVLQADQLLVGRNNTRKSSNIRVRQLNGIESTIPVKGDKLVCLRNNHEIGILNGQLWEAVEDSTIVDKEVILHIKNDEGEKVEVLAHSHYFEGTEPEFWEMQEAQSFDYGYALTVHKAQGSEFDKVVLLDEWYSQHRKEWLYTGITRAAEKITIVNM
jgi:exodeoxyribonuclease-5